MSELLCCRVYPDHHDDGGVCSACCHDSYSGGKDVLKYVVLHYNRSAFVQLQLGEEKTFKEKSFNVEKTRNVVFVSRGNFFFLTQLIGFNQTLHFLKNLDDPNVWILILGFLPFPAL